MLLGITQPTFLPWIGYFAFLDKIQKLIFLDNVQFEKRSWQQRNYICLNGQKHLMTISVKSKGKFNQKKWGKLRIKRELSYRDISKYNIELGLKEICEEKYLNTFNDLAQKRFEQLSSESNPQKKRRKIADYLLYRGWESFLVYDKIRTLV